MKSLLKNRWLTLLAIIAVLGALIPSLPFVYFQLMNWIVVGAALMTAYQYYRQGSEWLVWLFILVAVVFNPIAPLYLSALHWQIADIVVVIVFVGSLFMASKQHI